MSGAPPRVPFIGAAPLPLIGVALGLLAAAGFFHGTGSTAGSPHLPLWLLLLGMGVIVLGGGVAVVVLASGPDSDEAASEDLDLPIDDEPAADVAAETLVSKLPPVPEPPEPPRPMAHWSGELRARPAGSASTAPSSAATLRPTAAAGTGITPSSGPGNSEATSLACATCGKPLPARAAWRRCRSCGKSLCVVCLTDSVRNYGSGYCAGCAPGPAPAGSLARGV